MIFVRFFFLMTLISFFTTAYAAKLETFNISQSDNPGKLKAYIYIPDKIKRSSDGVQKYPLVVALHGCNQRATDYDDETGWLKLADEFNFIMLFPEQRDPETMQELVFLTNHNLLKCFNWMFVKDNRKDWGETGSIKNMIDAVMNQKRISKVYVTGLSAGAAMATSLLANYPDLFAGGALFASVPYGCAAESSVQNMIAFLYASPLSINKAQAGVLDFSLWPMAKTCMYPGNFFVMDPKDWGDRVRNVGNSGFRGSWPKVSIWNGANDSLVSVKNADDLAKQWADIHGITSLSDDSSSVKIIDNDKFEQKIYFNEKGQAVVEVHKVKQMKHGIPISPPDCGSTSNNNTYTNPWGDYMMNNDFMIDMGFCSSRLVLDFWGITKPAI